MTSANADADLIRDLEDRRYAAMERGDADEIESLCHPDLIYTHSTGMRDTRTTLVGQIRAGHFDYGPIEHPIEHLVIDGTTAVVAGRMRCRVRVDGEERELDNSCLAVWSQGRDGWLLLAYQPTPLPRA